MFELGEYSAEIKALWDKLHLKAMKDKSLDGRFYYRLDLNRESGIRVSCKSPEGIFELLIEFGEIEIREVKLPKWTGMSFKFVEIDVPVARSKHLLVTLEDFSNQDIFVNVCSDLIRALDSRQENESRIARFTSFAERWSRFFNVYGTKILSVKQQAGLFAELFFLKRLLEIKLPAFDVISSWLACEGGCHDFEVGNVAIEVKSTMRKEPRKVFINSELQLNDAGFSGLYLYVLTLRQHSTAGETLPELIDSLMERFEERSANLFKDRLVLVGYIDAHAESYTSGFSVLEEEVYHVQNDFPRLLSLPVGVGDVRYSLTLAVCEKFLVPLEKFLYQKIRKD